MSSTQNGKRMPDTKRYIHEHGTGITPVGINRALDMLPAMLAIGDPEGDICLDPYDKADVRAVLEKYQKEGWLRADNIAGAMFSNIDDVAQSDCPAFDRLNDQPLSNGGTKARFAIQAMPLAMTRSRDLAHEGFWHLLANKAGMRNMEAYTDGEAAGRSMSEALNFDKRPGKSGMAEKMAVCWKGLNMASACSLDGAENSIRMMQFCAMQNLACLGGYELIPDEAHARGIGRALAGGLDDLDAFKTLMEQSLIEYFEPEAQKSTPDRTPSLMDRLRASAECQKDEPGPSGHDGLGF